MEWKTIFHEHYIAAYNLKRNVNNVIIVFFDYQHK